MLGMPNYEEELFVNHVLLIAKQYLYSCRCRKTFPVFKVFMSRLRKVQRFLNWLLQSQKISYGFIQRSGANLIYNLCTEILLWFILSLQFRSEKHKGQSYVVLLCIHMYVGVSACVFFV